MPIDNVIGQSIVNVSPTTSPDGIQVGGEAGLSVPSVPTPSRNPVLGSGVPAGATESPLDKNDVLAANGIRPWDAGKIYSPGELVTYKSSFTQENNVYQATNAGGYQQGHRPGSDDSRWLYHGTVDSNYRNYASTVPKTGDQIDNPASDSSVKSPSSTSGVTNPINTSDKWYQALQYGDLRGKFADVQRGVGDYLSSKGVQNVSVYGGNNRTGSTLKDYRFESFDKSLSHGAAPSQDAVAQFFFLKPGDSNRIPYLKEDGYKTISRQIDLNVNGEIHSVNSRITVPKEWRSSDVDNAKPDYAYMYVPEKSASAPSDKELKDDPYTPFYYFDISNNDGGKVSAKYADV